MSETENGIKLSPPQNEFVRDVEGITAWAATFDQIIVRDAPAKGKQLIVVIKDQVVFDRVIAPQLADDLARLLTGEHA